MHIRTYILALALSSVHATAFAQPEPQLVPPSTTSLPESDQREQIRDSLDVEYLIGPADVLDILVVGFPEFSSKESQVDFAGKIQLPLIGSVMAAGKTLEQLSSDLQAAYDSSYLRRPLVTASLKEVKSRFVTVEGAVKQPGLYPVPTRLTLVSAISLAEGTTEFAQLRKIAVFRTVQGKRYAAIFDLKDIRLGRYEDPVIRHGDVVVVGNSAVRRIFRDIVQTAPFVAVFRPFG